MTQYGRSSEGISRRDAVVAGVGVVMLSLAAHGRASTLTLSGKVASTTCGRIRGTLLDGVTGYLGIPYAAAPVGNLRFMPPAPPLPWKGIRDGTRYGNRPVQSIASGFTPEGQIRSTVADGRSIPLDHLPTSWEDSPHVSQSEDCLVVDVWTRGAGTKARKPVMVWIHGGAFASGAGSDPIYTGVNFVNAGDVVLVNVTHRLNVFGYLHLGEFGDPGFASSGNVGMQDLVQALKWVHENIAAFGGDPGNVTIFGESGGGRKVSGLLAMPSAKGLFHKAIVMSGSANEYIMPVDATTAARSLLSELGLKEDQVGELQKVDARRLFDASEIVSRKYGWTVGRALKGFVPVVDGKVIPRHPFDPDAPAVSADIPLIVGTTRDEAAIMLRMNPKLMDLTDVQMKEMLRKMVGDKTDAAIALEARLHPDDAPAYQMVNILTASGYRASAIAMTERKAAQKVAPVFNYMFAWRAPGENARFRSNHALDVGPTFSNAHLSSWSPSSTETTAIQRTMTSTWTAFAHTGKPDNPTIPQWPAYDLSNRSTMVLDNSSFVVDDFERESRELWAN